MDYNRRQIIGAGATGLAGLLLGGCKASFSQNEADVRNELARPEYLSPPVLNPAWKRTNGTVFAPTPTEGPDIEGFVVNNDIIMSYANQNLPADTSVARMNEDDELEIRGFDFQTHRLPADRIDNIMPTAQPYLTAMMAQRHRGTGIGGLVTYSDSPVEPIIATRIDRRVGEWFDGSDEVTYQMSIGLVPRGASEEIVSEVTRDRALLLKNTAGWAAQHAIFWALSGVNGTGLLFYTAASGIPQGIEGLRFYNQQRHTWGEKQQSENPILNPAQTWDHYISDRTHKAMIAQIRDTEGTPHTTLALPIAIDNLNHTMPPVRGMTYFLKTHLLELCILDGA